MDSVERQKRKEQAQKMFAEAHETNKDLWNNYSEEQITGMIIKDISDYRNEKLLKKELEDTNRLLYQTIDNTSRKDKEIKILRFGFLISIGIIISLVLYMLGLVYGYK